MIDIINFLYTLNIKHQIFLWTEKGKIKYRKHKDIENQEEIFAEIKNNKKYIIDVLTKNNITSSDCISSSIIYHRSDYKDSPLSFAQERLLFIDQYEQGSNVYNIPISIKLHEKTNLQAIAQSLNAIIQRHEILRAVFKKNEETAEYYQRVLKVCLEIVEKKYVSQQDLDQQLITDSNYIFKLGEEIPIKIYLYQQENKASYLLINIHHIAFDGWSGNIFLNELKNYYNYYTNQDRLCLPELIIQYKDFAEWQKNFFNGEILKGQIDYWKYRLLGCETLNIPLDKTRSKQIDYFGQDLKFSINARYTKVLKQLAKSKGVTLYTVLLSIFNILLFKYTGQEDIVIGTPIANRHYKQLEGIIGFFVNSLVMRTKIEGGQSIEELISQVYHHVIEAQANQDLPFEKLVEELKISKDTSRNPIFQVMFEVRNFSEMNSGLVQRKEQDSLFSLYEAKKQRNVAKFDLSLSIHEGIEELYCNLNYATSLFNRETIERLTQYYNYLIEQVIQCFENKKISLKEIKTFQLLTPGECQKIAYDYNQTDKEYPKDKTICQLFEEQVGKIPNNIAVVFQNNELTYKELNAKANQLAKYLEKQYKQQTQKELKRDTLIALCLNRSSEMIIAMLAVLKAGGAYVPVDPAYPEDRIKFMLDDAEIKVLISQRKFLESLPSLVKGTWNVIDLELEAEEIKKQTQVNLNSSNEPQDLAYVMYTSGSTGKPKGVMILHQGVIRLVKATNYIEILPEDKIAHVASTTFDAATFEIWGALLNGASICIAPKELILTANSCKKFLKDQAINILLLTTGVFNQLIIDDDGIFSTLKYLLIGGEALNPQCVSILANNKNNRPKYFINGYGPTESTTFATAYNIERVSTNQVSIPIGKPIANTNIYILDKELNLVPPGIIGELYIGGAGLARGYLNQPELTAERFILNPFATKEDKKKRYTRLYKTGDLVRWLQDGNIEYIGRNDFQVKIRGFRIELGEIENVISKVARIKQVIVEAKEKLTKFGSSKYLVAYYIKEPEAQITTEELSKRVIQSLPEYMIPNAFVELTIFPLTVNGKIDRKALPEPVLIDKDSYVAPTDELECQLCSIWQEVLGIEKIGIYDNFFHLGGHSLLAMKLLSNINKKFQIQISLKMFFECPTISKIVVAIKSFIVSSQHNLLSGIIKKNIRQTNIPLSFHQQRLWFLEQLNGASSLYNVPIAILLKGALDKKALQNAIKNIISRHDVFRTLFYAEGGKAFQRVQKDISFSCDEVDLTMLYGNKEAILKYIQNEIQVAFDLTKPPLLRVKLFNLNKDKHILCITMHHIISDAGSINIFMRELAIGYENYLKGQHFVLPGLPIQYADFVYWQHEMLESNQGKQQLQYWQNKLSYLPEPLQLPMDFPRTAEPSYLGEICHSSISKKTLVGLRNLAEKHNASLFMTLLASFQVLLYRYTSEKIIVVGTLISNRRYQEIENLIGYFLNMLTLRVECNGNRSFSDFLDLVKETTLEAFENQDVPFDKVVDVLKIERSLSIHPIFQVLFTLLGQNDGELLLPSIKCEHISLEGTTAKFDLTVRAKEDENGLKFAIEYATDLFKKQTIINMLDHYKNLLEAVAENALIAIKDLPMLTEREKYDLLYKWNDTETTLICEKHICELVALWGEVKPDGLAVVFNDQTLTYKELNAKVNSLAQHFMTRGINVGEVVSVYAVRDINFLIQILAIFKIGAIYLPLDPFYPMERTIQILVESRSNWVLTDPRYKEQLREIQHFLPSDIKMQIINTEKLFDEDVPQIETRHNIAAYVIYTSGSTGAPKGAVVPHRGMLNHLYAKIKDLSLSSNDVIMQNASQCFDISIWQFFAALLVGGVVVIVNDNIAHDPVKFIEEISRRQATILEVVPSMLKMLLEDVSSHKEKREKLLSLRWVLSTGEALTPELCRFWFEQYPNIPMVNAYGPTECSDDVTHHIITQPPDNFVVNMPIGKPIQNMKMYVLGKDMCLVPIGARGELYVAGIGVGLGYLYDEVKTANAFIPNPFLCGDYGVLYKTGDIVKWLHNGVLEFIGRENSQVKIRGFRIELSEIESVLTTFNGISESVVVVDNVNNRKILLAYYVPEPGFSEISSEKLRAHVANKLPEYMIPSVFIVLDKFPLTANGKLDSKSFPKPVYENYIGGSVYVAPSNEIENSIANIWKEVLKLEQVGIHDNFFSLGGDSIVSIQVISRAREIGIHITLKQLFNHPTIAELAEKSSTTIVDSARTQVDSSLNLTSGDFTLDEIYSLVSTENKEPKASDFRREEIF